MENNKKPKDKLKSTKKISTNIKGKLLKLMNGSNKILTLVEVGAIIVVCVITVYVEQLYKKVMTPPTPTIQSIGITDDNF